MHEQLKRSEARRARRAHLNGHLNFTGAEGFGGEARIHDVSTTGCRVESETAVEPGMEFQLALYFTDHPWPLRVDRAIVRWVDGYTFGLEFDLLLPAQRERLRTLVMKAKPLG